MKRGDRGKGPKVKKSIIQSVDFFRRGGGRVLILTHRWVDKYFYTKGGEINIFTQGGGGIFTHVEYGGDENVDVERKACKLSAGARIFRDP